MDNSNIVITCDSACDISKKLRKTYGVLVTPMYIHQGDKVFRDGVDIRPDDIYKTVSKKHAMPQTAAIPPAEYFSFFAELTGKGCEVIHIALSSALSSTCANAMAAAEELPGVSVIDSKALSCAGGLLAVQAARLRDQGRSAGEIRAEIARLVPLTTTAFIVSDLNYLAKGGRCSTVTAVTGSVLGIKPAIDMREGKLSVGKKYRGSTEVCCEKFLRDQLALARETSDGGTVCLYHSGLEAKLFDKLEETVRGSGIFREILTDRAGGVISSHCGPNTLGFSYQKREG